MKNVNLFIKKNVKNIGTDVYVVPDIPEKKLNNAIESFKSKNFYESILAIYDNTVFGASDEGLVFTGERVVIRTTGKPIEFFYKDIKLVRHAKDSVTIVTKNSNSNTFSDLSSGGGLDYNKFANFLNTIVTNFDYYSEENQLKTTAMLSGEAKLAYFKIIVNMIFENNNEINEKELAEIFLLMSGLDLDKETRFKARVYINEKSKSNIQSISSLLSIIKNDLTNNNDKEKDYNSVVFSLVKDMIGIYFSIDNRRNRDLKFLEDNRILFGMTKDQIFLAYDMVENEFKVIEENLEDSAIKKNFKDIAAKAGAVGVPIAAVYGAGVLGLSAVGLSTGLATLGMGGLLGLSSMVTGIGVVILIGVGAYKGIRYLTGADKTSKYIIREMALHSILMQTQKTISLVMEDINYIVEKLNDTISKHSEQTTEIEKLKLVLVKLQAALKNIQYKESEYKRDIQNINK